MQVSNDALEYDGQSACLARYADLFDSIERTPLTQEQRQACISDAPATLVLAGAGTGKTSTLTGRAAFLVAHGLAKPGEILCLAFAREAALEIEDRMHRRLGARWPMQDFAASTFHSLGLHIVREVEKQSPALSDLCGNRQMLNAFIDRQLQQQITLSDEYAGLLFEYFSVIEPCVALSCEFATRSDYQAQLAGRLIVTLRADVVRYPIECLVANALCVMGMAYDYRKHYPHAEFLGRRRPYQCTFYLTDAGVYLDVFDATQPSAEHCAAAALASRLAAIHRRYGTRHIIVWEDPQYLNDIGHLIDQLRQQLAGCDATQCTGVDMTERPDLRRDDNEPYKNLASRFRDCLQALVGTARWLGLVDQIAALLPLYRQSCAQKTCGAKGAHAKCVRERRRIVNMTALVQPLMKAYEGRLRERGEIDFDDMIACATRYISSGRFIVPWHDVLIDEFQDISSSRFGLIAAMLQQRPGLRLFCVGDDWQAIYRFAGSQIRYSTHFREYVHSGARIVPLSRTFRFNQVLCDVSSQFLMKNPFQNRKQLHAASNGAAPVITIVSQQDGLATVLSQLQQAIAAPSLTGHLPGSLLPDNPMALFRRTAISTLMKRPGMKSLSVRLRAVISAAAQSVSAAWMTNPTGAGPASTTTVTVKSGDVRQSPSAPAISVLILARFKHLLPDSGKLQACVARYPDLCISASTVHASKGLEADYVCILNMEEGTYGFPSGRPADEVIENFLPEQECFEHADERRLFYVALTRARRHVWLLVPPDQEKMSVFVKELMSEKTAVVNTLDWRKAIRASGVSSLRPADTAASNISLEIVTGKRRGRWLRRSRNSLTDRQKLTVAAIVDKIKRGMISVGIGAEK